MNFNMRKRMNQRTIYLSEEENRKLKMLAKKYNGNESEAIRKLITDTKVIKPDMNILERHREDWKLIGNGLNAVARDSYRYGFVNERDLEYYINWLNNVIDDIRFNLELK